MHTGGSSGFSGTACEGSGKAEELETQSHDDGIQALKAKSSQKANETNVKGPCACVPSVSFFLNEFQLSLRPFCFYGVLGDVGCFYLEFPFVLAAQDEIVILKEHCHVYISKWL